MPVVTGSDPMADTVGSGNCSNVSVDMNASSSGVTCGPLGNYTTWTVNIPKDIQVVWVWGEILD
jgi:hypothetical protein